MADLDPPRALRSGLLAAALAVAAALGRGAAAQDDPKAAWDKIYDTPGYIFGTEPIPFLVENLPLVRRGKALDLAMGEGRNAVYLARQGFQVTAIDISEVAAEKCRRLAAREGVELEIIVADLRQFEFAPESYDLITNLYFPQPELLPKIKAALRPGGFFMYEQWLPSRIGGLGQQVGSKRSSGRANVYEYSELGRDELLAHFRDWRLLLYREAIVNHAATAGPSRGLLLSEVVSLVAQKPFD